MTIRAVAEFKFRRLCVVDDNQAQWKPIWAGLVKAYETPS